jgi:hypothetical protein
MTYAYGRALAIALGGVMLLAAPAIAAAQRDTTIASCGRAFRWRLGRGVRATIACDSAFIYNKAAQDTIALIMATRDSLNKTTGALNRVNDNLLQTLVQLAAVRDSIVHAQGEVIRDLHAIDSIQRLAYDTLRQRFDSSVKLVRAATANTDSALKYIHKVKLVTGFATTLTGGLVGGFALRPSDGFKPEGFALGAGVGLVVSLLVFKWLK